MRRSMRRLGMGVVIFFLLAAVANAGSTKTGTATGTEGLWRGRVVLSGVETGTRPSIPDCCGGWKYDRHWSAAVDLNALPPKPTANDDPAVDAIASADVTISYAQDDTGLPRADAPCGVEYSRATASLRYSYRMVVFLEGTGRAMRLILDELRFKTPDTHSYRVAKVVPECGAVPAHTEPETNHFSPPRAIPLGGGSIRYSKSHIAGEWTFATQCADHQPPIAGLECATDEFKKQTFTVTVDLRRISSPSSAAATSKATSKPSSSACARNPRQPGCVTVRSTKPTTTTKAQAQTTPVTTPTGSPVVPKEPTTPGTVHWLTVLGMEFKWENHKLIYMFIHGHDPAHPQWVDLRAFRAGDGGWKIMFNSAAFVHRIPAGPNADQQAVDYLYAHMHRR
jgi:hypothetical protein